MRLVSIFTAITAATLTLAANGVPITPALAAKAPVAVLAKGTISKKGLASVDSLMKVGLKSGYYPGASIAVGSSKGIIFQACYGWHDYSKTLPVSVDDVYDLASVTKVAATTLAVMHLYDGGRITLDGQLGVLLPQYAGTAVSGITVKELLTHTSGLGNILMYSMLYHNPDGGGMTSSVKSAAYPTLVDKGAYLCRAPQADTLFVCSHPKLGYRRAAQYCYVNPAVDTLIRRGIIESFRYDRRGKYLYSDLNFHLLKEIAERISGVTLDEYVAPLYTEMNMLHTGFRPLEWIPASKIIPTEDDKLMQRGLICGYAHDEIAAVSDNVGGNAGLFSNAADMANLCRMLLSGGQFNGRQVILYSTVKLFTHGVAGRGLGFDCRTTPPALAGGFGHTGYTGIMIWMDPSRDLFMVFLSNRVNPSRLNEGLINSSLRTKIWATMTTA